MGGGYPLHMTDRPEKFHLSPVIAVSDLQRAREFYEAKLGLDGRPTPGGWAVCGDQGTLINLLPNISDAGTASWPVATIRVADVHATVRNLRSRGVNFLGPNDLPFDLDEEGVSTGQDGMQVAWMTDPDGSVLTVYSLDDV